VLCIVFMVWMIVGKVSLACSRNVGTRCSGRGMRQLIWVVCCLSSYSTQSAGLAAVIMVLDATGHSALSSKAVSGMVTTGGSAPRYGASPRSAMMVAWSLGVVARV